MAISIHGVIRLLVCINTLVNLVFTFIFKLFNNPLRVLRDHPSVTAGIQKQEKVVEAFCCEVVHCLPRG